MGYINKIRLHTVRQRKIKNNFRIIIVRVVIINLWKRKKLNNFRIIRIITKGFRNYETKIINILR